MKYARIRFWVSPKMSKESAAAIPRELWKEEAINQRFGYQYHYWIPRVWCCGRCNTETYFNEGCVRFFWLQFVVNFGYGQEGPRVEE